MTDNDRPNIVVIWGDDVGFTNLSAYSSGIMGYRQHPALLGFRHR